MSIYSPETTKKYNRVLLAGSSLTIVQSFGLEVTNVPLVGLTQLDPELTKKLLAIILLLTIFSFMFSFVANDFGKDLRKKFFSPLTDYMINRIIDYNAKKNARKTNREEVLSKEQVHFSSNKSLHNYFLPSGFDVYTPFTKIIMVIMFLILRLLVQIQNITIIVFLALSGSTLIGYWPTFLVLDREKENLLFSNPALIIIEQLARLFS